MHGYEDIQNSDKVGDKNQAGQQANFPNLLDLHDGKNQLQLTKSDLLSSSDDLTMPITNYLAIRDSQEQDTSYLKAGISLATNMGRALVGADNASAKFDEARKDGNTASMLSLEHADRQQREFDHKMGVYAGAALKTALLFTRNGYGLAGLAAVASADEAKPSDDFQKQALDAALGAGKGLAWRFAFNEIASQSWNPIVKGWTLGMSDRLIDVGLTRHTYTNENGDVDQNSLKAGGIKTLASVFSPESLIVDAATGLAAGATLGSIDAYTGGKFLSSIPATRLTMAGVAGLTEGSLRDLNRQQDDPRQLQTDWLKVAKAGLQTAAIDTVSALPNAGLLK